MGTIGFTAIQERTFNAFTKDKTLARMFYFTGGTALSVFYLHHRESEDLDFFSEEDFDNEPVITFVEQLSGRLGIPYRFTRIERVRVFEFVKDDKLLLKIDFNHYPYRLIEKGKIVKGAQIDSLRDIATNKLVSVNQRADVKDFVDLYFLLKEFTIWDILYAVEAKFRMKLDQVMLAADFLKIEEFDFLPKMLVPLQLEELIEFFKDQAIEIGKKISR